MNLFKLPDLGEGLPEAEIQEWYVKEGDEVKVDQPLVAMETAKAVVDVPSPQAGKIAKLYGRPGDVIKTGAPLVGFVGQGETRQDAGTVVGAIETSERVINEPAAGIEIKAASTGGIKAMPAVRALALKLNVDLASLAGTGPNGAITAEDVKKAATRSPIAGEALNSARKSMALSMAKAHSEVAPAGFSEDADIQHWPENTDTTIRLLRAIVKACAAEPALNAHFDGKNMTRQLFNDVNLAIAVDTPNGLYAPVIKQVNEKSSEQLREAINQFKDKANAKSFTPQDLQEATITLSNFGTIGCRYAVPIVVPPTVAIIAVGKARAAVVAANGQPAVHRILPVSLTFDHRAVTGGEAARFLSALITDLELPI